MNNKNSSTQMYTRCTSGWRSDD